MRGAAGAWTTSCLRIHLAILYVRSPAAFLDDSIFSPSLLSRMLTKRGALFACQPLARHDLGKGGAFARLIIVVTSAFLLARSGLGLLADFFSRHIHHSPWEKQQAESFGQLH
jgi:hypothetical protein